MLLIKILVIALVAIGMVKFFFSEKFVFSNIEREELVQYFETLLFRGSDASFMVISKRKHMQFIQFSKTVISKGIVDMHLVFPKAKWSEKYIYSIENILKENNVEYIIARKTIESPLEFIDANLHCDIKKCVTIVLFIFDNIFRINPDIKYILKFSSISPNNVKIGF